MGRALPPVWKRLWVRVPVKAKIFSHEKLSKIYIFLGSSARHMTNSCPDGPNCGHNGPNILKGVFSCPKQWSWQAELPNGPISDMKIDFSCPSDNKCLLKKT